MFYLFKKTSQAISEKTEAEIIQEIHDEYDNASTGMLMEAIGLVEPNSNILEKAERLIKLGFVNSVEVEKAENLRIDKEIAKIIQYYAEKYPFNKFVFDSTVEMINEKYGLVCVPIEYYKSTVPDSKLKEIESFKFDEADVAEKTIKLNYVHINTDEKEITKLRKVYPDDIVPFSLLTNPRLTDGYVSSPEFGKIYLASYTEIDNESLLICAPPSDVTTEGLTKLGTLYKKEGKTVNVQDPIVLKPVKHGKLVLSKWGLEASDAALVNEKMN